MREITPRFGKTTTSNILTGVTPLKRTIPVFDDIANYLTMANLSSGYRTLSGISGNLYSKSLEARRPLSRSILHMGSAAIGNLAEKPLAAEMVGLTKQLAIAGLISFAAWSIYQMVPGNIPSAQ